MTLAFSNSSMPLTLTARAMPRNRNFFPRSLFTSTPIKGTGASIEMSGLMPELYHCVECRQELEPDAHRFSPNVGGTLCLDCNPDDANLRPLSLRALKVLRLFDRSSIAEACKLAVDDRLAEELKSLLSTTVGYWLGKEIRSNSFLERLHKESLPEVYI